jgi:hypothetical protein
VADLLMFFGTLAAIAAVFYLLLGPVAAGTVALFAVLILAGAGADARRKRRAGPRPPSSE